MKGRRLYRGLLSVCLGLALAACANQPDKLAPGELLATARAEYDAARQDAEVARHGGEHLAAAAAELRRANEPSLSESERNHFAYLARRHVEIARVQTREQLAEQELRALREQPQADGAPQAPADSSADALRAHAQAQEARETALAAQLAGEHTSQPRHAPELERLEAELAALEIPAAETERGLVLVLENRLFVPGTADPVPALHNTLQPLVQFLDRHPEQQVIVEGHTDSATPLIESLQLSQGRADSVRRQLIEYGVAGNRIEAQGYGPDEPVADNDSAAGRERNRRVEIVVTPNP